MRITEGRLATLSSSAVTRSFSAFAKAAKAVSTNIAVEKPSDDPSAWAAAARARARAVGGQAQAAGMAQARDRLDLSETALTSVGDALSRARELAVLFGNGQLNTDGRAGGAIEVRGLRTQVLDALSRRDADGQPLFAGSAAQAFDASGTYVGGADRRELEVGEGARIESGILGSDVVAALDALEALATALEANDTAAVHTAIDTVTAGHAAAVDARSLAGTQLDALDTAESSRAAFVDLFTQQHDRLISVDPAEAASTFARAQQQVRTASELATQIHQAFST